MLSIVFQRPGISKSPFNMYYDLLLSPLSQNTQAQSFPIQGPEFKSPKLGFGKELLLTSIESIQFGVESGLFIILEKDTKTRKSTLLDS